MVESVMHLIESLAHIVGWVGRKTNHNVGKIVALDPSSKSYVAVDSPMIFFLPKQKLGLKNQLKSKPCIYMLLMLSMSNVSTLRLTVLDICLQPATLTITPTMGIINQTVWMEVSTLQ
jgi:hypothetical protein